MPSMQRVSDLCACVLRSPYVIGFYLLRGQCSIRLYLPDWGSLGDCMGFSFSKELLPRHGESQAAQRLPLAPMMCCLVSRSVA
jgi:hypothetical protein